MLCFNRPGDLEESPIHHLISSFSPNGNWMKQKPQANGPERKQGLHSHRRKGQSKAAYTLDMLFDDRDLER